MSSLEFVHPDPVFVPQWHVWRQHEQARLHNPIEDEHESELLARVLLQKAELGQLEEGKIHRWFVLEGKEVVGTVAIEQYNPRMRSASFGYHIAPNCAGRGLGTQIVRQFIKDVFFKTTIDRLIATVHKDNIASKKILSKVGFVFEGTLRQYLIVRGERVDFELYSILRTDSVS
ncbi:MAG: GNAT family N-acetyltransferase [Bdellovibrionaceae bacterium]|nr:GNAT family N-acetyltransferase [Bdellovibrionales bacterium]MCB9254131.1 GNAT family N-acetyltransferase [Pseudobdellovibrionaceae bacterium]